LWDFSVITPAPSLPRSTLPEASSVKSVHLMLTLPLVSMDRSASPFTSTLPSFFTVTTVLPAVTMQDSSASMAKLLTPSAVAKTCHSFPCGVAG
jgi:hypothetical protein